jgi:hypothetical protein
MAFRESDPGPMPELGTFFKYQAIGDKVAGVYQGVREVDSNLPDRAGKKDQIYSFRARGADGKIGIVDVTANYDFHRRMQAAMKDGLKPGHKVIATYTHEIPAKQAGFSPMKGFKILWDDAAPSAPATPPPPPPKPADDPFEGI